MHKDQPRDAKTLNGAEKAFEAVVIPVPNEIKENMFITNKMIGYGNRK